MVLSYRVRERLRWGSFRRHVRPCYSSIIDQLLGLRDQIVVIVIYFFFFFLFSIYRKQKRVVGGYALVTRIDLKRVLDVATRDRRIVRSRDENLRVI